MRVTSSYLFDLDFWHIDHPPKHLSRIDPEGGRLAEAAAAEMRDRNGDTGIEVLQDGTTIENQEKEITCFFTGEFILNSCISIMGYSRWLSLAVLYYSRCVSLGSKY